MSRQHPAAIRQLVREEPQGGAQSAFAATTLWERTPAARDWHDKPVLAIMLNGAQGDDDEAHGGHFAIVTGRVGRDGAMGNWLTNNFYTLDSYSEKGIIAAPTPLDNYLADLNSGQAWYRPSYLLVAILADDRVPNYTQSALGRVYNQLYRHQLVYQHATMNCASISVDTMRALGWKVPARGPTSRLLAAISFPYFAVRKRSIEKADPVLRLPDRRPHAVVSGSGVRGHRRRPPADCAGARTASPCFRTIASAGSRGAGIPARAADSVVARVGRLPDSHRLGIHGAPARRPGSAEDRSGAAQTLPAELAGSGYPAAPATPG